MPLEFSVSIKDHLWQIYFQSIHTVVNCIKLRFQQKTYLNCYAKFESILLSAAKGELFENHISSICDFDGGDLKKIVWKYSCHYLEHFLKILRLALAYHSSWNRLSSVLQSRSFSQLTIACFSYKCCLGTLPFKTQKN